MLGKGKAHTAPCHLVSKRIFITPRPEAKGAAHTRFSRFDLEGRFIKTHCMTSFALERLPFFCFYTTKNLFPKKEKGIHHGSNGRLTQHMLFCCTDHKRRPPFHSPVWDTKPRPPSLLATAIRLPSSHKIDGTREPPGKSPCTGHFHLLIDPTMQLPSPEPFQIQAAGTRRKKDASRVGHHTYLARPEGFEPPAFRIGICCDIQLRYGRMKTVSNYSTPLDKFQSLVSQN